MNYLEVMKKLQEFGTDQNIKIYRNHGCDIDLYGVSMKNLKEIHKHIKNDSNLGLELFKSENADAIYLSQWLVNVNDISDQDISELISLTSYYMILENVIPAILIQDKKRSRNFIKENLQNDSPRVQSVAYSLYGIYVSYYDDIPLSTLEKDINTVKETIHQSENRVKYAMNNFLIAVGVYNKELSDLVLKLDSSIGTIHVDMGKTSCKVPSIATYIKKNKERGKIGVLKKF